MIETVKMQIDALLNHNRRIVVAIDGSCTPGITTYPIMPRLPNVPQNEKTPRFFRTGV